MESEHDSKEATAEAMDATSFAGVTASKKPNMTTKPVTTNVAISNTISKQTYGAETMSKASNNQSEDNSTTDGSSPIFGTHRERVQAGKPSSDRPSPHSTQAASSPESQYGPRTMDEHYENENQDNSTTDDSSPIFGTHRERVEAGRLTSGLPSEQATHANASLDKQYRAETMTEHYGNENQDNTTTDDSSPIFGTHRERMEAGRLSSDRPPQQPTHAKEYSPNDEDTAIEDLSDDQSDISDLGTTPPPPNTELRQIGIRHDDRRAQVQCTHTSWCDCPMHASHDSGERLLHLSEWALSSMQFQESSVRSTELVQQIKSAEEAKRINQARIWSQWVVDALTEIGYNGERDTFNDLAFKLVARINECFPVWLDPESQKLRIEVVGQAIRRWKTTMDYAELDREFCNAVFGRMDMVFEFQKFLPPRLRTVSIDEARREVRTSHVENMANMLEAARKSFE